MESDKIRELKERRSREIKKRPSQIKYFFILLTIMGLAILIISRLSSKKAILAVIASLIGFTMQRSRFCFAASFRDPIMVGTTSLFRAVILGLIISTIGTGIYQYTHIKDLGEISYKLVPGQFSPVGIHTVIGALMFGIGMVIAGACASGSLIRIGEGSLMQLITFVGISLGSIFASYNFKFWDEKLISKTRVVYLAEVFGFFPGLFIQLFILVVLYYLALVYDRKKSIMSDM